MRSELFVHSNSRTHLYTENLSVQERKRVADDLGRGKDELARVRVCRHHAILYYATDASSQVEQVIRDDYLIESFELLEMYCSLLATRFGLVEAVKYV